jgi:hypothetical protein
MPKLLLSVLLFCCACALSAQDTIFKKNGEIILSRVIEIGVSEIKYKKHDFENGPTYIESKSLIRSIGFSNGQKEVFSNALPQPELPADDYVSASAPRPPSHKIDIIGNRYLKDGRYYREREIQDLLLGTNDKKIMTLIGSSRDAKKMQYIGFGAFPLGIAALTVAGKGLYLQSSSTGNKLKIRPENAVVGVLCFAAAVTCPILSGVYKNRRQNYNRAAVRLYNEKF